MHYEAKKWFDLSQGDTQHFGYGTFECTPDGVLTMPNLGFWSAQHREGQISYTEKFLTKEEAMRWVETERWMRKLERDCCCPCHDSRPVTDSSFMAHVFGWRLKR